MRKVGLRTTSITGIVSNMSQSNNECSHPPSNVVSSALNEEAAVVFALSNSGLYKHFLERFLEGVGRLLRVPWWSVHLALYVVIWVAFILLLDVPKLYPNAGCFSFGGEQVGEVLFTTFMLFHIRKSRSTAILAAARITDTKTRLIWLRRYLAPVYWGWMVKLTIHREGKTQWILRTWFATVCVLTVYWGCQFIYYYGNMRWFPHSQSYWGLHYYPYPQLLYLYASIAKAAMIIAGFAQFWWLYGLIGIVRGKYPSNLNVSQRKLLYFECCQAAIRFSIIVSAATAIWTFGHALAYGFTFLVISILGVARVALHHADCDHKKPETTFQTQPREILEDGPGDHS